MSNPSEEVKTQLRWLATVPDQDVPVCYEVRTDRGVVEPTYPTRAAAEAALPQILTWAKRAEVTEVADLDALAARYEKEKTDGRG